MAMGARELLELLDHERRQAPGRVLLQELRSARSRRSAGRGTCGYDTGYVLAMHRALACWRAAGAEPYGDDRMPMLLRRREPGSLGTRR